MQNLNFATIHLHTFNVGVMNYNNSIVDFCLIFTISKSYALPTGCYY